MIEPPAPPPSRSAATVAVLAVVLVGLGGLLLTAVLLLFWGLDCFDGDGGEPYTARDSPRAAVCHVGGGAIGLLIPLAWLAGLVAAVVLLRRWRRRRSGVALLVGALVGSLLLPLVVFWALLLPSAECSDGRRDGYECATY